MNDSRILDFVNSVSLLCPLMFFSYFGAWQRTNSTRCARYAISHMESLILKSSLLRPLVYIKWKAWRPGNNMLNKHMNCLTRRATDQLWLKNLHRYSLISKQTFCVGNGLTYDVHLSGTWTWPFGSTSCCSQRLDQTFRWKPQFPRVHKTIAWSFFTHNP